MGSFRLISFHEVRLISIAGEELNQLLVAEPAKHGRIRDLVTVQVQNGQHSPIACGIQKLVAVPASGERPSLGFTVAHHAARQQIGIVEDRAISMGQRIAQLPTFMDGTRSFRSGVAGNPSGEGELLEQLSHSFFILLNAGIELGVSSFQVGVGHHAGATVSRTADIDHVEIVLRDQSIEMHINEVQSGCCAPMSQQTRLYVLKL